MSNILEHYAAQTETCDLCEKGKLLPVGYFRYRGETAVSVLRCYYCGHILAPYGEQDIFTLLIEHDETQGNIVCCLICGDELDDCKCGRENWNRGVWQQEDE